MVQSMLARAASQRGQPLKYDWTAACNRGLSYQGYGLDELLRLLLVREGFDFCDQCGAGDCTHEAARLVLTEVLQDEPPNG